MAAMKESSKVAYWAEQRVACSELKWAGHLAIELVENSDDQWAALWVELKVAGWVAWKDDKRVV